MDLTCIEYFNQTGEYLTEEGAALLRQRQLEAGPAKPSAAGTPYETTTQSAQQQVPHESTQSQSPQDTSYPTPPETSPVFQQTNVKAACNAPPLVSHISQDTPSLPVASQHEHVTQEVISLPKAQSVTRKSKVTGVRKQQVNRHLLNPEEKEAKKRYFEEHYAISSTLETMNSGVPAAQCLDTPEKKRRFQEYQHNSAVRRGEVPQPLQHDGAKLGHIQHPAPTVEYRGYVDTPPPEVHHAGGYFDMSHPQPQRTKQPVVSESQQQGSMSMLTSAFTHPSEGKMQAGPSVPLAHATLPAQTTLHVQSAAPTPMVQFEAPSYPGQTMLNHGQPVWQPAMIGANHNQMQLVYPSPAVSQQSNTPTVSDEEMTPEQIKLVQWFSVLGAIHGQAQSLSMSQACLQQQSLMHTVPVGKMVSQQGQRVHRAAMTGSRHLRAQPSPMPQGHAQRQHKTPTVSNRQMAPGPSRRMLPPMLPGPHQFPAQPCTLPSPYMPHRQPATMGPDHGEPQRKRQRKSLTA